MLVSCTSSKVACLLLAWWGDSGNASARNWRARNAPGHRQSVQLNKRREGRWRKKRALVWESSKRCIHREVEGPYPAEQQQDVMEGFDAPAQVCEFLVDALQSHCGSIARIE